jgi:hypothetical protein
LLSFPSSGSTRCATYAVITASIKNLCAVILLQPFMLPSALIVSQLTTSMLEMQAGHNGENFNVELP